VASSFNRVILVGNVTRDIQVKYTPGGSAVAELGLAVNRSWFDKATNQKKEEVTFVDVTVWGRTAEIAGEYLAKGRQVLIEGRLSLDQWDDKESGKKRSKLKVVCESLTMLGSKGESGSPRQQQEQDSQGDSPGYDAAAGAFPPPGGDGDVPF